MIRSQSNELNERALVNWIHTYKCIVNTFISSSLFLSRSSFFHTVWIPLKCSFQGNLDNTLCHIRTYTPTLMLMYQHLLKVLQLQNPLLLPPLTTLSLTLSLSPWFSFVRLYWYLYFILWHDILLSLSLSQLRSLAFSTSAISI